MLRYGPVAQLVRAPACHAGGRRFEPDPGRFVESPAVHRAVLQARLHDEQQTFSSSPQNFASQIFAGTPLKRTGGCRDKCTEYAAVAHLVERHLAKVEVASSSLVGRSIGVVFITPYMVTWPSGKARVCKTLIHQFKSGRHLQKIPGSFGFRDFLFCTVPCRHPRPLSHLR